MHFNARLFLSKACSALSNDFGSHWFSVSTPCFFLSKACSAPTDNDCFCTHTVWRIFLTRGRDHIFGWNSSSPQSCVVGGKAAGRAGPEHRSAVTAFSNHLKLSWCWSDNFDCVSLYSNHTYYYTVPVSNTSVCNFILTVHSKNISLHPSCCDDERVARFNFVWLLPSGSTLHLFVLYLVFKNPAVLLLIASRLGLHVPWLDRQEDTGGPVVVGESYWMMGESRLLSTAREFFFQKLTFFYCMASFSLRQPLGTFFHLLVVLSFCRCSLRTFPTSRNKEIRICWAEYVSNKKLLYNRQWHSSDSLVTHFAK